MAFFVASSDLITLFLGLEWFSISLYVLCAHHDRSPPLARGRAQVPHRRELRIGHPPLRQRARLRRDRGPQLHRDRRAGCLGRPVPARHRAWNAPRRASASRSRRRRSTSGRPTSTRVRRTPVTGFMAAATKVAAARAHAALPHDRIPERGRALDDHARRARRRSRSPGGTSPRSPSATSSGCSPTRASRTRASCSCRSRPVTRSAGARSSTT